ncbi:MAG: ABC transporter substrate-binding protein [Trueperaceae bacterium]|nr:ABC transporter substrate-binding protein [Trueperaceae bacterium]
MPTRTPARRWLLAAALALLTGPLAFAQPVTIDFWYAVGGTQGTALQAMIDEFNATNEYRITVNATYSGNYGETAQKVTASLLSGGLPAGGLVPAGPLWTCREGNHLIAEYLAGPEGLPEDAFWPVLWDYNRYGDEVCALPFNNSTMVMFYNKDLMRQAGLDPNTPPQTWSELVAQARAIVDGVPGAIGIDVRNEAWWLKALVLQNGGQIMDAGSTAPVFDDAAGVGALEFWKRLIDEGLMLPAQHGGSRDLFLAGRLGFLMASTASVATVTGGATFEFGTDFLPGNVARGSTVGGASLVMFPSTPEQEQATWRLLRFLTNVDNQIAFTTATGYVPISREAAESMAIQTLLLEAPANAAGFEQLGIASQYPHFFAMGTMDNLLRAAIEKVEFGVLTPAEAMAEAAAATAAEIEATSR